MHASILVPLFNKWELTRACLASLERCGLQDVEVIAVDDASTDETPRALPAAFPWVRFIRLERNHGCAAATNLAAQEAQGRVLIWLNNDTEVTAGWLDALLSTVVARPRSMAGAKLLYPNGLVQHAGVCFTASREPYHVFRNADARLPAINQPRVFQAVSGACLAVPRSVWDELGGVDESYRNGFEDIDLCLRARDKGCEIWYQPACVVVHHEGQSPGRRDHENANARRFAERWRSRLSFDLNDVFTQAGFLPETHQSLMRLSDCRAEVYRPDLWHISAEASSRVREYVQSFSPIQVQEVPGKGAVAHVGSGREHLTYRFFVGEKSFWSRIPEGCSSALFLTDRYVVQANRGRRFLRWPASVPPQMTAMLAGIANPAWSVGELTRRGRRLRGASRHSLLQELQDAFPLATEPLELLETAR
ncbi:MAG: glycosyltransferase family 2 protein [Candidatus Xenobia bacterium]